MDIPAQKRALRRAMARRILALGPDERRAQEEALAARFAALPGFESARTVLLYVTAFPEEIATGPLLRAALERGRRLVCPRVDRAERRLKLHQVEDLGRDLTPGTRGIPEPRPTCPEVAPDAIDWALVPGLAFDEHGYRMGRGAGHYDRLLPTLRLDAPRWALILDCQWVAPLPIEPHDVPLDGIISPGKEIHQIGML
ncbi:MAG: 5-formyltetrahydrofolate cyclo-ligase [Planctomycetaceae bacterium]